MSGPTRRERNPRGLFHIPLPNRAFELLPAQFAGYAILYVLLWLVFRFQYGQPFWRSLYRHHADYVKGLFMHQTFELQLEKVWLDKA